MSAANDPTHPRSVAFFTSRAFLAVAIIFAGWQATRAVVAALGDGGDALRKPFEPPSGDPYDESLERGTRAEVAALDSKVEALEAALARLDAQMRTRTISRSDDRAEWTKLNEEVAALQSRRADLAASLEAHGKGGRR